MFLRFLHIGCVAISTLFMAQFASAQSGDDFQDRLWQTVRDSGDTLALETFLDAFPDSIFAAEARGKLAVLNGEAPQPSPTPDLTNVDQCDLLAAHPQDLRRTYEPGVVFSVLQENPQPAIDACIALVRNDPTGRIAFQLSRSYVANGDEENRRYWVEIAASRGWERAQLRLMLLKVFDENLSKPDRLAVVDEMEQIGAIYPTAYVDAGRALRFHLGGTDEHGARILRLFERAAAFDVPDAYYQLALYARSRFLETSKLELVNLLTHLIEIDHQTVWAKDRLAQEILATLEIFRTDDYSQPVKVATAGRVGFGADRKITRTEMQRMVSWAVEAIETSDNYDRFPLEDRVALLRELLFEYPLTFASPAVTPSTTNAQVAAITVQTDPRMMRLWDSFCAIASEYEDPNTTIRAQVACDGFRAEFDTDVYPKLMQGHLSALQRTQTLARIRTHLGTARGDAAKLRDCITTDNARVENAAVSVDVTNNCPAQLWVDLIGYPTLGAYFDREGKNIGRGAINANETRNFTDRLDAGETFTISQDSVFAPTVCDNFIMLGNCLQPTDDGQTVRYSDFDNSYVIIKNIDWNRIGQSYDAAHQAAVSGVALSNNSTQSLAGTRTVDTRFGIPEDKCTLIVDAKRSLDEAYAYIAAFKNTDDWFWKIYETDTGWFAISAGLVLNDQVFTAVNQLKDENKIPADAYCKGPEGFVQRHL